MCRLKVYDDSPFPSRRPYIMYKRLSENIKPGRSISIRKRGGVVISPVKIFS
jgi:hypothetical protein